MCEYCDLSKFKINPYYDKELLLEISNNYYAFITIVYNIELKYFYVEADNETDTKVRLIYCFNCGRNLQE